MDARCQKWSFKGDKGQILRFEPHPKSGSHIDFEHVGIHLSLVDNERLQTADPEVIGQDEELREIVLPETGTYTLQVEGNIKYQYASSGAYVITIIEARIEEKQAEDAALEAKTGAIAKDMVEATTQAVTSAMPVPPTPTIVASEPAAVETAPPLLTETYRNEMSGFSIDYRVNWKVMEWTEESTTIVEIAQPLGSFVRVEIEYAPNVALKDFVASRLSSEDNFREDSRVAVESLRGYLSEGIGSDNQTPISILMTTNDPWAISAMFESARDLGGLDQPILQAMIESFQIFPPPTSKK